MIYFFGSLCCLIIKNLVFNFHIIYACPFIVSEHAGDTTTIGELCSILGKLAVRNEFCQEIVDLGGLKLVLQILTENIKSQVSSKQLDIV